jgi:cell division septation protein DedD
MTMAELTHDEDGFHEIQLSGKQIVALGMLTTVVLVSIFLCGVLVGRGVRAQQVEASSGPIPVTTDGPVTTEGGGVPGEAPPPTTEAPVHQGILLSEKQPQTPPLTREAEPQQKPIEPPPPPPAQPVQAAAAPAEVDVPTSGRPGPWVLQVTAVQNRASATQIVKRLLDSGHPAYLQNPAPGAPVIYRVRLGGFKDRREAESLALRLEKEEQLKPVVTRR